MPNTESTRYTLLFATAVCVVCALVVAASAVGLHPQQEENARVFRQKNVLLAAGLVKPDEALAADEVQKIFDRSITVRLVDLATGRYAQGAKLPDPATYDQRRARNDPALSREAPPNAAKISRLPTYGAVYLVRGERDGPVEQVVLPVEGIGMWGTLYGFLAIDRDGRTVRGITFYDQKETPGLGGEIGNPKWQALWVGRHAYDERWEPRLTVIKGAAGPPEQDRYRVDAISGATITSNGVARLVGFWLSADGYGRYMANFREGGKG